jgi:GGDEF domain-containing protein
VNAARTNGWEQIHLSIGIATYDAKTDKNASETLRRADKIMYANKRAKKEAAKKQTKK